MSRVDEREMTENKDTFYGPYYAWYGPTTFVVY